MASDIVLSSCNFLIGLSMREKKFCLVFVFFGLIRSKLFLIFFSHYFFFVVGKAMSLAKWNVFFLQFFFLK